MLEDFFDFVKLCWVVYFGMYIYYYVLYEILYLVVMVVCYGVWEGEVD